MKTGNQGDRRGYFIFVGMSGSLFSFRPFRDEVRSAQLTKFNEDRALPSQSNELSIDVLLGLNSRSSKDLRQNSLRSRSAGFTLVELLVVLAIIGLIASLIGPRVLGYLSSSKAKTSRIQIESLVSAVDLFYLDNGRYPSQSEGLSALVKQPENMPSWNGPYLKGRQVPLDPWGRPFVYKIPGQDAPFDISPSGADSVGTNDQAVKANL